MTNNLEKSYDRDISTIHQIARGIRFSVALFSVAAGMYCGRAVLMAPKLRVIYEELLSPSTPLPSATAFIFRHQTGILLATAALTLITVILAYRLRSIFAVIVIGATSALVQVCTGLLTASALMTPVQQIIQALAQ